MGSDALRGAEITNSRHGYELTRYATRILAPGVADDREQLARELKRFWRSARFRTKHVAVAVGGSSVSVRVIELHESALERDLTDLVADAIPMPIAEAVVDQLIIEEFIDKDGEAMVRMLVVAAPRSLVEPLVDVVSAAGLICDRVDLGPMAAARAVTSPAPDLLSHDAEVVIDMEVAATSLVVVVDGTPRLVRILPGGVDDHAVDEIVRSVDYYRQTPDAVQPARCVVTGSATPTWITGRLRDALRVPVDAGDTLLRLSAAKLDDEQAEDAVHSGAVAIGLAVS